MEKKLDFKGTQSLYHGFTMNEFTVDGCKCVVVEPQNPRAGRQWIWKAEYFDAFPAFELKMLELGFYFVFIHVDYHCGAPDTVKHWEAFYDELTGKYGFAPQAILFGLSVGGLYIYNFAASNPEKVRAIYADNPVCDFKSWPGGKGSGPGNEFHWQKLIEAYGFKNEAEALQYDKNPVDNLAPILNAKIKLIHIAATDDEVVPIHENTDLLERHVKAQGGEITVIRHPGGHHPHGLPDLTPLINFLLATTK